GMRTVLSDVVLAQRETVAPSLQEYAATGGYLLEVILQALGLRRALIFAINGNIALTVLFGGGDCPRRLRCLVRKRHHQCGGGRSTRIFRKEKTQSDGRRQSRRNNAQRKTQNNNPNILH